MKLQIHILVDSEHLKLPNLKKLKLPKISEEKRADILKTFKATGLGIIAIMIIALMIKVLTNWN